MFKIHSNFETTVLSHEKCYLGSIIPAKTIQKSFGLVSMITRGVNYNINEELPKLIEKFITHIEDIGANTVINFRFETGSYQSKIGLRNTTYLLIYGEAVIAS
jgi:uncharacterized protein YbjQ (UPF0145 family)